ncbi:hypothetical protein DKZ28_11695 [Limosilactobacillus reuteri]|uniref:PD-(D/E)XK nuclease family protein n=2 Tax=Limosilactobacillus reuteri TaxID=1598 RepID=UPI000D6F0703|nr:PD-(D/E)XK nuclease family protein [Limosilactobacillus reuteri]PWT33068.1 hypothetical protein DKZ24_11695 [Limosilactobacillus reuteri]PWT56759.1 hypothetical protein DKZ30_11670 [Limosilactobacillus reuteri]PWT62681.1 hypothetical protein DKZ28_11695 [Limosilactobacillus reuteri]
MRLNKEQLAKIQKKYGVDKIWSFSRVNSFHQCPWDFWSHYIEHMKLDSSNVYTDFGTFSHNNIQAGNTDLIDREEMINRWDKFVDDWSHNPNVHHFDSEKIKLGYINNLSHYYRNTELLWQEGAQNIKNELPVITLINHAKYVFVGYIDTKYTDKNGNIVLVDYKTSSKSSFSKSKMPEKSEQLLLYALGVHQMTGVPLNKIKARFDMMKYVIVHYKQENGKWNTSVQERRMWVSKMSKKINTKLKKASVDPEKIDEMLTIASLNNNLDNLPEFIKEQFYITNYYIEIDISEESVNKVVEKISKECQEIVEFENLSKDDQISYMEINHPYDESNYFDRHLCAYHTSSLFKKQEGIEEKDDSPLEDFFESNNSQEESEDLISTLFS